MSNTSLPIGLKKEEIEEGKYRNFNKKEIAWIGDFIKLMARAPKSLFMFVGPAIVIYPKDDKGMRYMRQASGSLSVDGDAPSVLIQTPLEFDGGDY